MKRAVNFYSPLSLYEVKTVMIIQNSGKLSVDYFISYFQLVLNSRTSDIDEANKIIFQRLFNNDSHKLGKETYGNFIKAYNELSKK